MDTQTQIDRLIELAIIQRSELKQLVEQLPQLRDHLNAEVEKVFDETEPQLRAELEEWTTKQTADKTAALGVALEAKIADLAKSLEVSTQARYNAIIAEREQNARLAAQAEAKIAEHAASLPGAVKEIVSAELARFPRAGEIDQLRKEFAEPRGLNPRGKWQAGETYNKLDLVTINGDSYTSNTDGNRTRPSRSSADWTLVAARGTGGGGGPTSLSELTTVPSDGDLLIGSGNSWVTSNLTAGAGISITVGPGAITISATDGDITLDDGTAASPSLHFTNDPDTGIYRPAANTLGISTSGVQRMYVDENGITTVGAGGTFDGSVHAANGNANNPSFSFTSDQDTGFFRHQPNEIGVSLGGTQKATLTSTTFTITPNLVVSGTGSINGTTIPASKTLVVTTDKLSALASTSSSELAGVISDETGTGALVFANTPTLVTPNIGAATGTSLTLTGNVTASDAILGSSGPSVKSTLSARAPRQGLVFDGTAQGSTATSITALGTTYSVAFWINPDNVSGTKVILNNGTRSVVYLDNAAITTPGGVATGISLTAGKMALVVLSNTAGTMTPYLNGVALSNITQSVSIEAGTYTIGGSGTAYMAGFLSPLIYNRALSASEVVALYEAGAPAGADYPATVAGTDIVTSGNFSSATGWAVGSAWSISGGVATTNGTADAGGATELAQTGKSFKAGQRIRVTFTLGNVSAGGFRIIFYGGSANTLTTIRTASGTYTEEVVLAGSATAFQTIARISGVSLNNGATLDDLSIVPLGLLLAPDAAQAGGGLTWYDTSGNAANITLPASGVSWNVPFAGYVTAPTTTNLTLAGGSSGASLALGQGASGSATLSAPSGFLLFNSANTTNARTSIAFGAGNRARVGGLVTDSATGAEALSFYSGNTSSGATEYGRLFANGNLFVGASPVDGGQKLQVAGSAKFNFATNTNITLSGSGTISTISSLNDAGNAYQPLFVSGSVLTFNIGGSESARFAATTGNLLLKSDGIDSSNGKLQLATHTTSAGGIGFGTDASLYRYQAGGLALDATNNVPALMLRQSGTNALFAYTSSLIGYIGTPGAYSLNLQTNNTTALTLDSSQRATFASTVTLTGGANQGQIPTNTGILLGSATGGKGIGFLDTALVAAEAAGTIYSYNTLYAHTNGKIVFDKLASNTGQMLFYTQSGAGGGGQLALTLDSSQNATFAGTITSTGAFTNLRLRQSSGGTAYRWTLNNDTTLYLQHSTDDFASVVTNRFYLTSAGAATFTGAVAIGNTVNTVSPTSPNRTITIVVGGTTYYIPAKTTND